LGTWDGKGKVSELAAWRNPSRRAQQGGTPVAGVLRVNPKSVELFAEPFRRYMQGAGWVEGRNVRYDFVWADIERIPKLASELVSRKVDLIVTFGGPRHPGGAIGHAEDSDRWYG
jgi:hypothetical protein